MEDATRRTGNLSQAVDERGSQMDQAKQQSEQIIGISNVAYDLMAVMTNKLEGIAAMEEYKLDAEEAGDSEVEDLLNQMEQQEVSDVDKIKKLLLQRLK